jgi:hypothetical protein
MAIVSCNGKHVVPIEICNALGPYCSPDWDGIGAVATAAAAATAVLLPTWLRRLDEQQKRNSLGYALLLKMVKIQSDLFKLKEHVDEQRELATKNGGPRDTWSFFRPYASMPSEVVFSTDELALLFSLRDYDTFNSILSMDEVHRSDLELMRVYGEKRSELMDMLPGGQLNGLIGSLSLDTATYSRLAPYMAQLDQLVADMVSAFIADSAEANAALLALEKLFKEKLKLPVSVEFPLAT